MIITVKNIKKILFLATVLFVSVAQSPAQVVVERSRDKVIISGTAYYIHVVKKGETAYSISRAYGITVDQLTRENPPAVYGVKEGQVLRIPVDEVRDVKPAQVNPPPPQIKDEDRYIYHKMQPGETIYSLSKKYGVSETGIINANPGIDISNLSVGAEIAIPKIEFMNERQDFAVSEPNYIFHKVAKGESMSSIADQYGMTLRQLRRENRDIRFPQVGDYIRIPVAKLPPEMLNIQAVSDTTAPVLEKPELLTRPTGYTPVTSLSGTLDVAVLLPFYLKENSERTEIDSSRIIKGKKIYRQPGFGRL